MKNKSKNTIIFKLLPKTTQKTAREMQQGIEPDSRGVESHQ